MYIPKAFEVDNLDAIFEVIENNGFATLVSMEDGRPNATHLPIHVQREDRGLTLQGHFARTNPQWQGLDGQEVLVMFHGPHCFVSDSWYQRPSASTWNYAAVHVYGRVELVDEEAPLMAIMERLVSKYEQGPGSLQWNEQQQGLLRGIIGFTLRPTEIQAKFKMNQNRSEADQWSVIEKLSQSENQQARAVADLMQRYVVKN